MNFPVLPFANWLHRISKRHSFSGEFTANATEWFCAGKHLKGKIVGPFEVSIQNLNESRADRAALRGSETFEMLLKAQSGVIPVAALATAKLEKNEVALFLARELLFLRSVADGAKLSMLATLFDELHVALLDGANAEIELERSIKKVS